jgi:hypothetical protein
MIQPSDITLAVPSSGRTRQAAWLRRNLLPTARVYVAEDERDTYLEAGIPPEALHTHPNLVGLAKIRNHIVKDCPTKVVVMVDDDCEYVMAMPGRRVRVIKQPDKVLGIVLSTTNVAADMGSRVFGWSTHGRPVYYRDNDPFSIRRPLGGALGVIGKEPRWDERLVVAVDTDCTLQELMANRIVYTDGRFFWQCGPVSSGSGGLQRLRTSDRVALDQALLKEKWGDFLQLGMRDRRDGRSKKPTATTRNQIMVERKQTALGSLGD